MPAKPAKAEGGGGEKSLEGTVVSRYVRGDRAAVGATAAAAAAPEMATAST